MTRTGPSPTTVTALPPQPGVIVVPAEESQLQVRWIISPLDSTVMSLREGAGLHPDAPPEGWMRIVRDRARDVDLTPLAAYTSGDIVLAALNPVIDSPAPTFEQQVESIRSTPAEQVRTDLTRYYPGRVPKVYQPFVDNPRRALARVCAALVEYWDAVVRPVWPIARNVLEREVLVRSHSLGGGSVAHAVNTVHPQVRFEADELRLTHPGRAPRTGLSGRTLTLVPTIGGPRRLAFDVDGPGKPWLSYAVDGAAAVWGGAPVRAPSDRLCALIGTRRAHVLSHLARPTTLMLLGRELGVAAGTLSEHLFALSGSGLVDRIRLGKRVYFRLTCRGEALMDLFEHPTS